MYMQCTLHGWLNLVLLRQAVSADALPGNSCKQKDDAHVASQFEFSNLREMQHETQWMSLSLNYSICAKPIAS